MNKLFFTVTLVFCSVISFAQTISTSDNGRWDEDIQWGGSSYPEATSCYTTININHSITIRDNVNIDLTGCGVVTINIGAGALLRLGHGANGSTLELASGSSIVVDPTATIEHNGPGAASGAVIEIGGNTVWTADDGDVNTSGEGGVLTESTTNGSLPVELLDFNYEKTDEGAIALNWRTASEINNDGFYIEKSIDGVDFEQVGWVNGYGDSNEISSYTFMDYSMVQSVYYRLKQVDFDGQFENLQTIRVIISQKLTGILYPNPAQNGVSINVSSSETFSISLHDLNGRAVLSEQQMKVKDYENFLNSNFDGLLSGSYILSLKSNSGLMQFRLVKSQ